MTAFGVVESESAGDAVDDGLGDAGGVSSFELGVGADQVLALLLSLT